MINFRINFILIKHPISIGLILLIQTLLTSSLINCIIKASWFSYILFLIIIGGLLIIFIYITRLISNKKFKFSYKILAINFITIIIILITFYYTNLLNYNLINYLIINQKFIFRFNKYINTINISILIIIITFLLITIIAVVKITQFKSGPLRQKF